MELELAVEPRDVLGKATSRLRRRGLVPGVVFGKGTESTPVQVDAKRLETLYRSAGRTTVIQVKVGEDGRGAGKSAIIKSLQRNPLTGQALHVDLFVVDLTHEMQADVPLSFIGEPPAVRETGGTLLTNLSHVRVRALPADFPHEIPVDVTVLVDLDAAIHVSDLLVDAERVHILAEPDELVAKVVPPRVEEEPVVVAAPEEGAPVEGEEGEAAAGAEGGAEAAAEEGAG